MLVPTNPLQKSTIGFPSQFPDLTEDDVTNFNLIFMTFHRSVVVGNFFVARRFVMLFCLMDRKLFLFPCSAVACTLSTEADPLESFRNCLAAMFPPKSIEVLQLQLETQREEPDGKSQEDLEMEEAERMATASPDPGFYGSTYLDSNGTLCLYNIKNLRVRQCFRPACQLSTLLRKSVVACVDEDFLSLVALFWSYGDVPELLSLSNEARSILLEILVAFNSTIAASRSFQSLFRKFFGEPSRSAIAVETPFRQALAELFPQWSSFLLFPDGNFFDKRHTFPCIKLEVSYLLRYCFGIKGHMADAIVALPDNSDSLDEIARSYEEGGMANVPGGWPVTEKQFRTVLYVFQKLLTEKERFSLFAAKRTDEALPFMKLFYCAARNSDPSAFFFASEILTILQTDYAAFHKLDVDAINKSRKIRFLKSGVCMPYAFPAGKGNGTPSSILTFIRKDLRAFNLTSEPDVPGDEKIDLAAFELLPPQERQLQESSPLSATVAGTSLGGSTAPAPHRAAKKVLKPILFSKK
jgi:hypothetical protein